MARSVALLFIVLLPFSASAVTINVPADYPTIQEAVDASADGDTVLVAPGEYEENIHIQGQQITLTSSDGPYETTILGHIRITDFPDTTGCVFQGFTQIGQDRDPYRGEPGFKLLSGKAVILGNIIYNNVWEGAGGGILVVTHNAAIKHNIIENNWAVIDGGGIDIQYGSEVELGYNIIRGNQTGIAVPDAGIGGGIYCQGGWIFYNLIYDNRAECVSYPGYGCGLGGGIMQSGPEYASVIYNNTVVNNSVLRDNDQGEGGGIYVAWQNEIDTLILENNIIAFNEKGGLFIKPGLPGEIKEGYNLLYGNEGYDIFAPETSFTDIFADPLFVDTSARDYRLLPNSPCIDAGNPDYPPDPDSTRVDIGALFFDQSTDIEDENTPTGPYDFELSQNYPNPFNGQTNISYTLQSASRASLIIFDITGRVVRTLLKDQFQNAGTHRYIWDGTDNSGDPVSTAIYFYELQVGRERFVKSMILLR